MLLLDNNEDRPAVMMGDECGETVLRLSLEKGMSMVEWVVAAIVLIKEVEAIGTTAVLFAVLDEFIIREEEPLLLAVVVVG